MTDIETLAVNINAVRTGGLNLLASPDSTPAARELAGQALNEVDSAAVQLVRQIAVSRANALRPYQGSVYYRMAEAAMLRGSDCLAAAWALVDETPVEELGPAVRVLVEAAR